MDESVFQATFVEVKPVKSRGVFRFTFEVAEEMATECLRRLGGLPRASESRFVAIARLDPTATEFPSNHGEQHGSTPEVPLHNET